MKKDNRILTIIIIIVLGTCLTTLGVSIYNIVMWSVDNKNIEKEVSEIEQITDIKEVEDNEKTEIIEQKEEIPKSNPYWDFIKTSLINVDFTELKKKNSDTKGWIQVNGTNINYPFVQTTDNDYYLTKSFNKKKNNAGWVFLDYRNNIDNLQRNTIIYAHGRIDTTMFGSLKNIFKSDWHNNPENYVVKLSTEKENTMWQVFSVYQIPNTNDYIRVDFINDDYFQQFLNMLSDRSYYDFAVPLSTEDKILTLSTCYDKNEKVVMHAKLIKKEIR